MNYSYLMLILVLLATRPILKPSNADTVPSKYLIQEGTVFEKILTNILTAPIIEALRNIQSESPDKYKYMEILASCGFRPIGPNLLMWHHIELPHVIISYNDEEFTTENLAINTGAIQKRVYHIPKTGHTLNHDNYFTVYILPFPKQESVKKYKIGTAFCGGAVLFLSGMIYANYRIKKEFGPVIRKTEAWLDNQVPKTDI